MSKFASVSCMKVKTNYFRKRKSAILLYFLAISLVNRDEALGPYWRGRATSATSKILPFCRANMIVKCTSAGKFTGQRIIGKPLLQKRRWQKFLARQPLTPQKFNEAKSLLVRAIVHTTTYGIETISFLGKRFWSTLPNIIKQASTFSIFKSHIEFWKGENCNCRLCKIYIPQVGYLS